VGEVSGRAGNGAALGEMPDWAKGYVDRRHLLRWDSSQYIGNLGVNGVLISCIVDTGAHRTIIDQQMAKALGLTVRTKDIQCGRFSVPGSDAIHAYAGVVEGITTLRISENVEAKVENMRVIDHPHPFKLLGADVLSGGRSAESWNFTGMKV
jgi:hypothetical protein